MPFLLKNSAEIVVLYLALYLSSYLIRSDLLLADHFLEQRFFSFGVVFLLHRVLLSMHMEIICCGAHHLDVWSHLQPVL